MPEAILDIVTDQTKESPTGGQRLINEDLKNLEKIKQLGAGDYGLVTTEGGVQLQLPPTTVAERQADNDRQNQTNQAELERRTEETRVQQEAQARALEQQRLAHEAEVARIQQERAQLGQQQNAIAGELKDVKPLKKAVTQAEQAAKLAKYNASLKAQNQPMTAQNLLNKGKAVSRPVVGGLAGAAGVMSLQEALERFKAGDTSEGVLKTIQASSAAAMLTPPIGKNTSRLRKAGALGAIGSYGYDFGRELFRKNPQEGQ
jgi:myosin heavy subunit